MCFGGSPQPVPTPAPAPDAPQPLPTEEDIATARRQQDQAAYGTDTPNLRVNRTGVAPSGGSGIRM